jgi:hypothetical protein
MTAGMTNTWKRIVLCFEIDKSVTISTYVLKRGFQAVRISCHLVAEMFQEATYGMMWVMLLIRELRILVDLCSQYNLITECCG